MLFKGQRAVGTNWIDVVGVKHCNAVGFETLRKTLAVITKHLCRELGIFHG